MMTLAKVLALCVIFVVGAVAMVYFDLDSTSFNVGGFLGALFASIWHLR